MKDIQKCKSCELYLNGTILTGNGDENAEIMFILDSPTYYDVKQKKILDADLGELFDKLLKSINIRREDVYVTTLIKCRPNGGAIKRSNIKACWNNLHDELDTIKPKIIVTMGTSSFQTITKSKIPIGQVINYAFTTNYGYLLPMYNLQYILRDVTYHKVALHSFVNLYKLYKTFINPNIVNLENKLSDVVKAKLNGSK